MSRIQEILDREYLQISPLPVDPECASALGIGDILESLILLKEKLISAPIVIDLSFFADDLWYPNPLNALQFRLKLIKEVIEHNNISEADVIYTYNDKNVLNEHLSLLKKIKYWDLVISDSPYHELNLNRKYVIFHTKYRLVNYTPLDKDIFQKIRDLYKSLTLKHHDIILLGERKMVTTCEQKMHDISTIYEELTQLKSNNHVIDLTKETIYNSLDIDNYIRDCNLIKHADKNILFGYGGQLMTCMSFNHRSTLCLVIEQANQDIFSQDLSCNFTTDFAEYEKKIREL